jgi:uncharacterized protein YdeI (YjbR/CyaY-like superfamily)
VLKLAKQSSGQPSVTPAQAVEAALCYGWTDSQRKSHDGAYFLQKYSPRRRGSSCSRANVERAERLIAAGRMRAPGLVEVEAAKADGRWMRRTSRSAPPPSRRIWRPRWRGTSRRERSSSRWGGPTAAP